MNLPLPRHDANATQALATASDVTIADDDADEDEQTPEGHCARCGDPIFDLDESRTLDDDDTWCEDCWQNYGSSCDGCSGLFDSDNVDRDYDDNYYCSGCRDNGYGRFDDDYDNQIIFDYDADILNALRIAIPETNALLFGFELEFDTEYSDARWDAARTFLARVDGKGIVKCDGSIGDGNSGIELVTAPASLDGQRILAKAILKDDKLDDAFADDTCGMHVHASRAAISASQEAKLSRFIYAPGNRPFVEFIAGRRLLGSRYADIAPTIPDHGERYRALNLTNDTTIEFRIFASTTSATRVCANLEACAALIAFCGPATTSNTLVASPSAFINYVQREAKDYPHLATFLRGADCPTESAASQEVLL